PFLANALPIEELGQEHIPVDEELGPETAPFQPTEQWTLVPDGNGHLHLVNTDPYGLESQGEPEPFFNAATDTIFRLFTRANRNTAGHVITNGNAATLGQFWSPARQTRFIIHGWNNNGGSPVNTLIRNAYLDRGDFNVITVDWGVGAQNPNYVTSRNHINAVGATVASFIEFLNVNGLAFNFVYVSGHSLGGHAAGITGKRVTRGRLHSIIALDPALPLFSINAPNERVASTDANYVEVIHTNAGLLGFDLPIGQADFYPNGGRSQPGCGVDIAGTCAHGRAFEFFAESIRTNPSRFNSVRCANYDQILNNNCVSSGANRNMGGDPSNLGLASGVFHLITNAASPFARG
ncbi:phospholipase A1 VesT1.02-like, partial [Ochlerotatus camptorhynchus]|uniref:phospholipase A1 VesT1.02-like n=1 Tax=Ochlerotatus camptorhynchus TaxID=644619 RepID=UPI0031D45EF0